MASFWLHFALLVPLSGLTAAAVLAHSSPNLDAVKTSLQPKDQVLHNLPSVLSQTVLKQSAALELTEGELNEYLSRRVHAEQSGPLAALAKPEAIFVDLEDGLCRVHFCWLILGHRTVTTSEFTVTRTAKDYRVDVTKGAYGRLQVPRALLPPLIPALHRLATVCELEIDALFKFPHIRLAKDKVVLDPKF